MLESLLALTPAHFVLAHKGARLCSRPEERLERAILSSRSDAGPAIVVIACGHTTKSWFYENTAQTVLGMSAPAFTVMTRDVPVRKSEL